MKQRFFDLVDYAIGQLRGSETLLAGFCGETSDFIRFNRARVRQAGSVTQAFLRLTLIDQGRRIHSTLSVAFDPPTDQGAIRSAIRPMRSDLPSLPVDPLLLYATTENSSDLERSGRLPDAEEALDCVVAAAGGADLVGIFASGPVYRGFANSMGQRNWHRVDSFQMDWSVYLAGDPELKDKAVKSTYASETWNAEEIANRIGSSRDRLGFLAARPRAIEPGQYRAFLTPAAMEELVAMLSWDGVSARSQRTRQSTLQKLVDGELTLSPMISLRENTADGLAPSFDDSGFPRHGQGIRARRERGRRRGDDGIGGPRWRHTADVRCTGGARPRHPRFQPVVPELLGPIVLPRHRVDPLCHLLGGRRTHPRAPERDALRRFTVPDAGRRTAGADS